MRALPEGLLAAWYGDDFTGAAATMEVFAFAGLDAVLFLDLPTQHQLARFPNVRGIGIAGVSRSKTPDWMRAHLPRYFEFLAKLDAPLSFYKVCSTFDSAPDVGSIGCACDIALDIFGCSWVPMLVAAPPIGRWQAFGNLFAGAPGGTFRLDRHPIMSRHPVTPMTEADLGAHLSKQIDHSIGLIDLPALKADAGAELRVTQQQGARIVSIDAVDEDSLTAAGRLIWTNRQGGQFAIGSQGILYALVSHWRQEGALAADAPVAGAGPCKDMIAVSGSASAITATQIDWAEENGFVPIRFDATQVLDQSHAAREEGRCLAEALTVLGQGAIPLIYAAKGPDDPAIAVFNAQVAASKLSLDVARESIGAALGRILRQVFVQTDVARAVISGGDTSGHAASQLEIFALTALAPTVPAAALCKAHSENPRFDGVQLALKGGQMGEPDYFGAIQSGGGTA